MRRLQVQALARRVGCKENLAARVDRELLGDLAPVISPDSAVNRFDCLWPAEQRADSPGEVLECVAMLREHDEFAALVTSRGGRESVVLQDRAQLGPLSVGLRRPDGRRRGDEISKFEQPCVELLDRARCSCGVDELLLDALKLLSRELFVVELVKVADGLRGTRLRYCAAREDLLLAALEAIGPTL